jgi:(p)ppGpp synthase/HD superfamily hydrolase
MSTVRRAIEVACEWHGEQRYGKYPYILHLDDVARFVRGRGERYEIVAYLHDILEDTPMQAQQLEDIFGDTVRLAVEKLTDPPGKNRKERKAGAYAKLEALDMGDLSTPFALVVKAADRLANVRACVEDRNDGLLDMYRKEHPVFVKAVRRIGLNEGLTSETTMLLSLPGTGTDDPEKRGT